VPGLDSFEGKLFHSARWDHDASLAGKRVGVVGTGASAIQIVPELAGVAQELVVFQRSAPYVRSRHDRTFSEQDKQLFRRDPRAIEEMREMLFWGGDYSFAARRMLPGFIDQARAEALGHLAAQVQDPQLRAALTPDYEIGCKRVLVSDTYYPALQKPGVRLEPAALTEIRGHRAVSSAGTEFELDVLVFATGFETYDLPSSYLVFGREGVSLGDHWGTNGMQAYNSTTVAGFPNLFLLNGPGTSLGHNSLVFMIETQIDHVLDAVRYWSANDRPVLEVDKDHEETYAHRLDGLAAGSVLLQGGCSSWYVDPRNGRATLSWPDLAHRFRDECAAFDPAVYHRGALPAGASA
jgi:cation diffusion facilitator CzcD-associated flavoprotein CzcO